MYWKSDNSFPMAGGWSVWRPPFGRRKEGEAAVRRATWQWHPMDPVLVSSPGAERMLPPICFPDMGTDLQRRMIGQYRLLLVMMACMILGFAGAGIRMHDLFFVKVGVAFVLLFVFVVLQYAFLFHNMERLRQYSRFCSWCYLQPQRQVILMAMLLLFAGGIQCYLQWRVGSLFDVIERYGLIFENSARQPWRYIVGPFFHAGLAHWIANLSLLIVVAGLSYPLGSPRAIWAVFLSGVLLPAACLALLPHWIRSDAFLGVSGGVFALYGWVVGITFRYRRVFPPGLWWLLGYFVVATAAISSVLDHRASWFVHSFGFVIGVLAGVSTLGLKLDFDPLDPHAKTAG